MTYGDSSRYLGEWRNNERHGTGEEISASGGTRYGKWSGNNMVKKYSSEQLSTMIT